MILQINAILCLAAVNCLMRIEIEMISFYFVGFVKDFDLYEKSNFLTIFESRELGRETTKETKLRSSV